jgi:hypothetical protein
MFVQAVISYALVRREFGRKLVVASAPAAVGA